VKIYLTLLLSIMLLNSNQAYAQETTDNQFSLKNGALYFSKHIISDWGENSTLPICIECSKNIYSKSSASGPMLFRQINDANGELVLLQAEIQPSHSFALNTGRAQYSVTLLVDNENNVLHINHKTIRLQKNKTIELTLATQRYFILLQSLEVKTGKKDQANSLATKYKADILIWLNQRALHKE